MKKTTFRRSCQTIGATCAVAGLVSTWDIPAAAQTPEPPVTFAGQITPTHDLTAVYFIFAAGSCAPAYSKKIADFVAGNTTTAFNVTINSTYGFDDAFGNVPSEGHRYSIIGVYDTLNSGVSLAFDPAIAADILSQSPAPGYDGPWTGGYGSSSDEAAVAARLLSGFYNGTSLDDAHVGGMVDPNQGTYFPLISLDPLNPSTFSFIDFSGAAAGGSGFVVEVVPEPGTMSLLAAGTTLLSMGWLRRRKIS